MKEQCSLWTGIKYDIYYIFEYKLKRANERTIYSIGGIKYDVY